MPFYKNHKINVGRIPWNKGIPIYKKCLICHTIFSVKPCEQKIRKHCSVVCQGKAFAIRTRGRFVSDVTRERLHLSHLGQKSRLGSKTSQNTRIKISAAHQGINITQWKEFKKKPDTLLREKFRRELQSKVFERDDYTCQICGVRGVTLQVDHIQSWAEYIGLRFCIDNCRTLCMKCHYKITYGKPLPAEVKAWGHNLKEVIKNSYS